MPRSLTLLSSVLMLGAALAVTTAPAQAQEAQGVRETLNRAQLGAAQRAVEDLLNRLRGGTSAQAPTNASAPAEQQSAVPPSPTLVGGAQPPAPAGQSTQTAAATAPATVPVPPPPGTVAASGPAQAPNGQPTVGNAGPANRARLAQATASAAPTEPRDAAGNPVPPTVRVQPSPGTGQPAAARGPAPAIDASAPAARVVTTSTESTDQSVIRRAIVRLRTGELCLVEIHPTRGIISQRIIGRS